MPLVLRDLGGRKDVILAAKSDKVRLVELSETKTEIAAENHAAAGIGVGIIGGQGGGIFDPGFDGEIIRVGEWLERGSIVWAEDGAGGVVGAEDRAAVEMGGGIAGVGQETALAEIVAGRIGLIRGGIC